MKGFVKWLLMAGLVMGLQLGCSEDDTNGGGGGDDTGTGTDQGGNDTSDTGTGQATGGGLLLDDFEDLNTTSLLGTEWTAYLDNDDGGASTITLEIVGEGYQSSGALSATFALDAGTLSYDPFVGCVVPLAADAPFDISPYAGVSYMHKGVAHTTRIEINAVADYAYHELAVPASDDWVLVELPLENFAQPSGWGDPVEFDPADVHQISMQVQGPSGITGNVMFDDVQLYAAQ
jgi:endoglucanase